MAQSTNFLWCCSLLVILQATATLSAQAPIPPVRAPTIWKVVSPTNVTCILLQASISLSVNYTDVYNQSRVVEVEVPATAEASGSCSESDREQQFLVLTWSEVANSTQQPGLNSTLTLTFQANTTVNSTQSTIGAEVPPGKFVISQIGATLQKSETLFPNATNPPAPFLLKQAGLAYLPTSVDHSFACGSLVKLGPIGDNPTAVLNLVSSQIQAFRNESSQKEAVFGDAEHCPKDEVPSGSIVGTVILTIAIIVLLALGSAALATYVLKKRRASTASGYENM